MLNFKNYIASNRLIMLLLTLNKLFIYSLELISFKVFLFWITPFIFFFFYIKKAKPKLHQSFCFILLIYFTLACLRVFGLPSFGPDIIELTLLVVMFILTAFATKIIINEKSAV